MNPQTVEQRDPPQKNVALHLKALSKETQLPALKAWYEPGIDDCYYDNAYQAAKESNERLRTVKFLSPTDLKSLNLLDPITVLKDLEKCQETLSNSEEAVPTELKSKAQKSKEILKNATKKTLVVAKELGLAIVHVAEAMQPVIAVLVEAGGPQYGVPYALLRVLFKFIEKNATNNPEDVTKYFERLADILTTKVSFYKDMIPTGPMKALLASIYILMLDFIETLVEYSNLTTTGRLWKNLFKENRDDYNFAEKFLKIEELLTKLVDLGNLSMQAMQKEGFLLTREFAAVMPTLYTLVQETKITTKLSAETQAQTIVQGLLDIILPDNVDDVSEELELWRSVHFRLSPGDFWDRNGLLDNMATWSKSDSNLFFAVGPVGSKDSWVTSFSLDVISILKAHLPPNIPITFALCDRPSLEHWSPKMLMNILLAQLLEQNPMLVLQQPRIFNPRTFRKLLTVAQIWHVFNRIADNLDGLFIVIDRIECCKGKDPLEPTLKHKTRESNIGDDLFAPLVAMAREKSGKVRIIVTSAEQPSEKLCEELKLKYVLINMQRPPRRRDLEDEDEEDTSSSEDSFIG